MEFNFEKLLVWQKSKSLTVIIYTVTSNFPAEEKFGLSNQLRRASISIASNIAEGSSRFSDKEKNRFYEIAYGSAREVLNQSIISNELGFVEEHVLEEIRNSITEICKMLSGLRKSSL